MAFNPFSQLTSKIFGGLLLLSLVTLGPGLWLTRAKLADARETITAQGKEITALDEWVSEVILITGRAAENPSVSKATVKAQIQALGEARINLTAAIESQNAALDEMARQSEQAIEAAREAERKRKAAVRKSEQLQAELRRRALAPVDPAEMEQAVRDSQDELFEAGL
jgi:hypothetical protein